MLLLLSPSKTLDLDSLLPDISVTQPRLLKQSEELVSLIRNYSSTKLSQLMDISDKLSELNFSRYQNFSMPFNRNNSRPALCCFKGDVYEPMDISNYGAAEFAYAQSHVRILSGLYGVLRPMDLMQPYRLEMGTKLTSVHGKDLYQFWGDKITALLNEDLAKHKDKVVINLASEEYFKAVRVPAIQGRVITIVFKEKQKNGLKVVGLFAKKARGMMTDYLIRDKVKPIEKIKDFSCGGYGFQSGLSEENRWVFVR